MVKKWGRCKTIIKTAQIGLGGLMLSGILVYPSQAEEVFRLTLDSRPFSPGLCKQRAKESHIRIKVSHHRDLVLHRLPGQYIPEDTQKARSKDYTHFITVRDLSNDLLTQGAIAFRSDRAAIFTPTKPKGISRQSYLAILPAQQKPIAIQALNTFLRLHTIINAAIDTCRPYPPTVTYGTDDEIDRIEAGRLAYHNMIEAYNNNPTPQQPLFIHEAGISEGFFDPEADQQRTVSYQALNPLSFYVP